MGPYRIELHYVFRYPVTLVTGNGGVTVTLVTGNGGVTVTLVTVTLTPIYE